MSPSIHVRPLKRRGTPCKGFQFVTGLIQRNKQKFTHRADLESSVNLACLYLACGRKNPHRHGEKHPNVRQEAPTVCLMLTNKQKNCFIYCVCPDNMKRRTWHTYREWNGTRSCDRWWNLMKLVVNKVADQQQQQQRNTSNLTRPPLTETKTSAIFIIKHTEHCSQ